MNAKDIAYIRRQFKLDNDRLRVFDIFHVYIMKESSEIYHHECQPFALLERDQQELFMGNFKKVLSGRLDEKLFELHFRTETGTVTELEAGAEHPAGNHSKNHSENHSRRILYQALQAQDVEEWKEQMLRLVDKMLTDFQFAKDTVITFIRGEVYKPAKKREEVTEEYEQDEGYAAKFILCSINTTEQPPKTLVFDYISREFKYQVTVDPIIKLAKPQGGFLYPCVQDGYADVNHVLYAAEKANQPDLRMVEEVLDAELPLTAQQDKEVFEEIMREVAGEELEPSTLAQVYEEIKQYIDEHEEEDEPPKLDVRDVERVLVVSGVEDVTAEKVERAFELVTDDRNYELKAANVLPKFSSKSIKIETQAATIAIRPEDLKYIKQVNMRGKRCLVIEIDEDIVIEGFAIKTEDWE